MNTHFRHIEDLVLFGGLVGANTAIEIFHDTICEQANLTEKVDGSPAFMIGRDDQGFYVSLKTGDKKMYSPWEVYRTDYPSELKSKLGAIWEATYQLEFDGIIWGDYLYYGRLAAYQPNTLIYNNQSSAKIGLCLHTQMLPDGTEIIPEINNTNPELYLKDTWFEYHINPDERLLEMYDRLKGAFGELDVDFLNRIKQTKYAIETIAQYHNFMVKGGIMAQHEFVNDKFERMASKLKTNKGYLNKINEGYAISNLFRYQEYWEMERFRAYAISLKLEIINRLNEQRETCYVRKTDGTLIPTGPEGYVVHHGGEKYKLVNRSQFSAYNFSSDFVKGWNEPTRN